MKKRFFIAFVLILFLSTYNFKNTFNYNEKLSIKKIILENNLILDDKKIKEKLSFLYKKNLFLLDINSIEKTLEDLDLISSFEVKKVYPNSIRIKIFEKRPIAIIQNKTIKKYFTSNGDTINYFSFKDFDNLPIVFGDKNSFSILYEDLKAINFPMEEIKKFYLFESKRWDLEMKENKLIKLPIEGYTESLKNFMILREKKNFIKYEFFDYRIQDQLILR